MNNEKIPGIYFLYDSDGNIIYIGQTEDLDKRLFKHSAGNWNYAPKEFDMIFVHRIKNKKQRIDIENKLIKSFKPKLNGLPIEHWEPSDEEVRKDFEKVNW